MNPMRSVNRLAGGSSRKVVPIAANWHATKSCIDDGKPPQSLASARRGSALKQGDSPPAWEYIATSTVAVTRHVAGGASAALPSFSDCSADAGNQPPNEPSSR